MASEPHWKKKTQNKTEKISVLVENFFVFFFPTEAEEIIILPVTLLAAGKSRRGRREKAGEGRKTEKTKFII